MIIVSGIMPEEFSRASMKRLIKKQGDKRVSDEAAEYLGSYLEEWAEEVVQDSGEVDINTESSSHRA